MNNRFLNRMAKQGTTGHGNVSEKRVAVKLGARLQPASGAMASAKSDAKMVANEQRYRIECKSTTADTMRLDLGWLTKITSESMTDGSTPVVTVSFVDPSGKPRTQMNAEWVLIPMYAFKELTDDQ